MYQCNCCKAAQALIHQTASEKDADFVLACEYNRTEDPNWYVDTTNKAAIVNEKKARRDDEGRGEAGFRWVSACGLRMFSCYWSPNSTLQK